MDTQATITVEQAAADHVAAEADLKASQDRASRAKDILFGALKAGNYTADSVFVGSGMVFWHDQALVHSRPVKKAAV